MLFTISPYKLNMYLECPRHYWWNYLNPPTKNKQPTRAYFTMGDHVHNALKLFYSPRVPKEKRTKKALLWLLEEHWKKKAGKAGGFFNEDVELEYKERAQLMLSAYCDREDLNIDPFWASDTLLTVPVSEKLNFMGKIDRIDETEDGGLHIIDYKTSKEEREDEWQLPMYAAMASRYFNKPVRKLSYLFLETGSWNEVSTNVAREIWVIQRVEKVVEGMPKDFDKQNWQCPDGGDCQHCDYLKEFGIDPLAE